MARKVDHKKKVLANLKKMGKHYEDAMKHFNLMNGSEVENKVKAKPKAKKALKKTA